MHDYESQQWHCRWLWRWCTDHGISNSICGGCSVGPEAEGCCVRLLHPRRHGAHAAHVVRHTGVGHELGRHRGHLQCNVWCLISLFLVTSNHLMIVSAHGRCEGVPAAHAHPHAPPTVQAGAEEVCHPGSLLLGLGGELPVPGLDPVLLHSQGPLHLPRDVIRYRRGRGGHWPGFICPINYWW